MGYRAPVEDMAFALRQLAGIDRLAGGHFENFDNELIDPILEEAGKLASDVLAPLNQTGDEQGAQLTGDGVVAPHGFAEAYRQFAEGGWMGLAAPEEWGGQGLPRTLANAVMEMLHGANMSFGLCPMLSAGAIEALLAHGGEAEQKKYLPKLISGEWTGTMNLTEPQAGSDVGALKTKAVPQEDGSYAISGQKIYITWGDHDMTENIIHLVLARLPDAPEGSRGISLFVVPKVLVNEDGSLGARNGVKCIGLEKKIGIHASPTCVMEYEDATGWLVGEENKGLACMFTMMNAARLNVGLEGVGVSEAAYQTAYAYAQERKQGRVEGVDGPAPILHHADIRRTLTTMRANTMAARAICYACGVAADLVDSAGDEATREAARLREELLTPIAKAWSTDAGVEMASLGVQIHGGMGFMNETLAAQLYRDARIAPIYEGTNGIQAIDLVGRKLAMAEGRAMGDMVEEVRETARAARETNDPQLVQIADRLVAAADALDEATGWMKTAMKEDREKGLAGATAYLELAGDVIGGHFLAKGALSARADNSSLRGRMTALAGFFAETSLAEAPGRVSGITRGGDSFLAESEALFGLA
ncbi:MAG: acyl-CoA dehydrogenase [Henriciella sp.]|jgi:alkylation response protein AidB-like acyl-CoA dehydrogenase|uniref:acyl-CoA dehydrogenase n=1 Tax=Henriciella sp. TaxID=1968823 RepID=UPI000C0FCBDD|nr:acyl-CoA dehydrogenase [Henriciella sp.]MAN73758.1 acyl-CoA dehydrogenase [Henriciella sp.]PHR79569.1 MAG: acyl-CoA dehydrogenase [Henriciella sp.]|tara:strand:+ start:2247 stop:4013 length:1767 start_codon:yes stop_codon:yes gene_type:complete